MRHFTPGWSSCGCGKTELSKQNQVDTAATEHMPNYTTMVDSQNCMSSELIRKTRL